MTTQTGQNSTSSSSQAPKPKIWLYLLIGLIAIMGIAYYSLINRNTSSVNHDYYRVLYEASNKFNENLNSLERMHQSEESEVSIRSLLPSYRRSPWANGDSAKPAEKTKLTYRLSQQKIHIISPKFEASIELEDLLPTTSSGFSRYLFADSNGKVVAENGGEKTISIFEMTSINQQLMQKNKLSSINFSSSEDNDDATNEAPLPTYSSHVDMQLSHGDYRVFIFPFVVEASLNSSNQDGNLGPSIERLYLVGLLPKHQLQNKGSGQWNISVLVVSLISLLFCWALIRLFLLPENHSITRFYRVLTQSSSYLFYLVVVALILSYLTQSGLQSYKDQEALNYAQQLSENLQSDLKEVFNELGAYQGFYSSAIAELAKLKPLNIKSTSATDLPFWSYPETVDALNNALQKLSQDLSKCTNCKVKKPLPKIMAGSQWHKLLDVKYEDKNYLSSAKGYTWKTSTYQKTLLETLIGDQGIAPPISYQQDENQLGVISFYSGELSATFDHDNGIFNTHIPADVFIKDSNSYNPDFQASKILTVFATDEKGFANLPSIYFQESNAKPQAYQLSHREYFKRVRDYRGWLLSFPLPPMPADDLPSNQRKTGVEESKNMNAIKFRNVFIQRLLNINDGTRGTTISVPMHQPNLDKEPDDSVAGYVLGADVILPSVSLAPPSQFDFSFMVVDRNTGLVLFHTDENRSLSENLFYAGHAKSQLSQWIKAGLDKIPEVGGNQIDGFYHGEPGRYSLAPTVIDDWVMVVFSPNDSLDSFMTNQFFYILVTFLLLLSLILLFCKIGQHWTSASWLKINLGIPCQLDIKRVMLICTALLTTNYGLFYIGQLLQMSFPHSEWHFWFSPGFPLVGVAVLLLMIYRYYGRHFQPASQDKQDVFNFNLGAKVFSLCLWLVALMHFAYLQFSASMPLKSLQFYYSQQICNGMNKEYSELTKMALKRYPNSVTQQRIPPFALLPMQEQWQRIMLAKNDGEPFQKVKEQQINESDNKSINESNDKVNDKTKVESNENNSLVAHMAHCEDYLTAVQPDDYPKMSTLMGASFVWKWMKTYLINAAVDKQEFTPKQAKTNPEYDLILTSIVTLIALVWLWFYYNRKVLWPRIYCPSGFLKHIEALSLSVANMKHEKPNKRLVIHVDSHKLAGIGLAVLLRNQQNYCQSQAKKQVPILLPGFETLFNLSPCLQIFSNNNTFLPNLKIDLSEDSKTGLLNVKIWDIETCLEKVEFRQYLLDLIMEIKSLTMAGHLNSFTIFSGFMSLRRVKMKDPLAIQSNSTLEHAEYMSWSECLMDFTVEITSEFVKNIDKNLLYQEMQNVPELKFLSKQLSPNLPYDLPTRENTQPKFWQADDNTIKNSEWATIHYILLHADALYRFKWESCSSAEKLALYNLAKQHRLNPRNTEMIEHLAVNGMIKVHKDHLVIVNKSFAHFVLHAESQETLNKLVKEGEAGIWKSYRLPLGLLIVLIIGAIALTSGQSIYIIAASLAGVLGTIGSLASSANMLKGQFKE